MLLQRYDIFLLTTKKNKILKIGKQNISDAKKIHSQLFVACYPRKNILLQGV